MRDKGGGFVSAKAYFFGRNRPQEHVARLPSGAGDGPAGGALTEAPLSADTQSYAFRQRAVIELKQVQQRLISSTALASGESPFRAFPRGVMFLGIMI
jgi:hypothetical protein